MAYVSNLFEGLGELGIKKFDPIDEFILGGGYFSLLEEVQYFVIVALDEWGLVVVEYGDVGLKGFDDVGEEAVVLHDVFL